MVTIRGLLVALLCAVGAVAYLGIYYGAWVAIAILFFGVAVSTVICTILIGVDVQSEKEEVIMKIQELTTVTSDLSAEMSDWRSGLASVKSAMAAIESDLKEGVTLPDLSDLVDEFEKEARERYEGLSADVQSRGFTIIWNSLPYNHLFESFDDSTKALYFDAVTSGDWRKLNARLRK